PHYSSYPYLFTLLPAAFLGLGAFVLGIRPRRRVEEPLPRAAGGFDLGPSRTLAAMLHADAATALIWHLLGAAAAGHYLAFADRPLEGLGIGTLIAYEALGLLPLASAVRRFSISRSLGDAFLVLGRARGASGEELAVQLEQEVRRDLVLESLRIALICD